MNRFRNQWFPFLLQKSTTKQTDHGLTSSSGDQYTHHTPVCVQLTGIQYTVAICRRAKLTNCFETQESIQIDADNAPVLSVL